MLKKVIKICEWVKNKKFALNLLCNGRTGNANLTDVQNSYSRFTSRGMEGFKVRVLWGEFTYFSRSVSNFPYPIVSPDLACFFFIHLFISQSFICTLFFFIYRVSKKMAISSLVIAVFDLIS